MDLSITLLLPAFQLLISYLYFRYGHPWKRWVSLNYNFSSLFMLRTRVVDDMIFRITSRLLFSEKGESESRECGRRSSRDQRNSENVDASEGTHDRVGKQDILETHL